MSKQETFDAQNIEFVSEQDGVPEREFKRALINSLRNHKVKRAYLVRVVYDVANEFNIVLCLRSEFEASPDLDQEINHIFSEMFRIEEHLDVLFLSKERETELATVASPFFSDDGTGTGAGPTKL